MNRDRGFRVFASALAAASLFLPVRAQANVQEISGLSPRATALGNAFSAVADDFSACYYNPAGLGQQDHHSFYLGYMFVKPYLKEYQLSTGIEHERDFNRYHSVVFGALVDLTQIVNIAGHNLVLGVAATVGDNFKAAWRIHDWSPAVDRFVRFGDQMNRAHIFSALGLEVITDRFFIGAGFNLWQDIYPKVEARLALPPYPPEVVEQNMNIKGDFEISAIAGILVKPFPWLSLSYTFRDSMLQTIPVDMNASLPGLLNIKASIPLTDYFIPWNMTGGLAVRPWEPLLLTLDLTFYHWSSFSKPAWRGAVKNWNDTVVPRIGTEYRIWEDVKVRAGYYYDPTPVPDQSDVPSNYLDSDKHVLSVGFGYAFTGLPWIGELPLYYPVEMDGTFQYQFVENRIQEKLPSTDEHQQGWRIKGSAFALGIGVTIGF